MIFGLQNASLDATDAFLAQTTDQVKETTRAT